MSHLPMEYSPGEQISPHTAHGTPHRSIMIHSDGHSASRTGSSSEGRPARKAACLSCRAKKLRCDRSSTICGNCARNKLHCQYDPVVRKTGPKRGYLRSLEERLVRAERLFERHGPTDAQPEALSQGGPSERDSTQEPNATLDPPTDASTSASRLQVASPHQDQQNFRRNSLDVDVEADTTSSRVYPDSGTADPFPSENTARELHEIYFKRVHPTIPIVHEARYLGDRHQPRNQQKPLCLQYIIWALAASLSDKHLHMEKVWYRRAKQHIHEDDFNGYGEAVVSIAHCQTWVLISHYEITRVVFQRAWPSIGQAVRFSQMLQLHRLDDPQINRKQNLPFPRDQTEVEERRRIFWLAYCLDKFSAMGTGWPQMVDEDDILTNLPCPEEAFGTSLVPSMTLSLSDAVKLENIASLSPTGAIVLVAFLAGRILNHLKQRKSVDKRDNDQNTFWEAHQRLDTLLLDVSLSLPDRLRLPLGVENPNVVFVNMNLQALTICLHQTAVLKANTNENLRTRFGNESASRCIAAAVAITSFMRMVAHTDLAALHIFTPFCLFMAARAFIQQLQSCPQNSEYIPSLRFLHQGMHTLKRQNPLADVFLRQFSLDVRRIGHNLAEEIGLASGAATTGPNFSDNFAPIFDVRDKPETEESRNRREASGNIVVSPPSEGAAPRAHELPSPSSLQEPLASSQPVLHGVASEMPGDMATQMSSFPVQAGVDYWPGPAHESNGPTFGHFPFFPFIPQLDYTGAEGQRLRHASASTESTPAQLPPEMALWERGEPIQRGYGSNGTPYQNLSGYPNTDDMY